MKNLYSRDEFVSLHEDVLNEGFFGKIFQKLFASVVKDVKKVKGGGEMQKVFDKYKTLIEQAFQKLGGVEQVDNANQKLKPQQPNTTEAKPASQGQVPNSPSTGGATQQPAAVNQPAAGTTPTSQHASVNTPRGPKLFEDTSAPEAPEAPAAPAAPNAASPSAKPNGGGNVTDDQKKQLNLNDPQTKRLIQETQNRIGDLRKNFENEINGVLGKFSQNKEYSSNQLKQLAEIIKNEFGGFVYDLWYKVYTDIGDQNQLQSLMTKKKENEKLLADAMKVLDNEINKEAAPANAATTTPTAGEQPAAPTTEQPAAKGETAAAPQIAKDKNYGYHSDSTNQDITVKVLGEKGIGDDGKPDPEHTNDYRVENSTSGNKFWVLGSKLKQEAAPAPAEQTTSANTTQAPAATKNAPAKVAPAKAPAKAPAPAAK